MSTEAKLAKCHHSSLLLKIWHLFGLGRYERTPAVAVIEVEVVASSGSTLKRPRATGDVLAMI